MVRRPPVFPALAGIAIFSPCVDCYNLGTGALRASTMRKRINAQAWDLARAEMKRWNKATGKVSRGLEIRREAEAALL